MGQTGRILKARIVNEHKNHINWNTIQLSVITVHRLELFHEFDWENIKILETHTHTHTHTHIHTHTHKRLTFETIFIKK